MAKILVISPTPSHPQDAGNRARIFSLLFGLRAAGHQVFFAFVRREACDESAMEEAWDGFFPIRYHHPEAPVRKQFFDKWAKRLGSSKVLPYRVDDWYLPDISHQLDIIKEQVRPEVVLVEYVFLSKAFECFGSETLKILDTHDIFGDRHLLYRMNGLQPQWFYTTIDEENKALDRADLVIAIQEQEAAYFSKQTQRPVITVGHLAQLPPADMDRGHDPNRILFVGSPNPINVTALKWFLADIFPLVLRRFPDIKLEILGGCAEKLPPADGLILTGRVTDLAPHYRKTAVVINPVRFGTGLKIKTIEALAHGRPLVTTGAGAAGLEKENGRCFLMADSPQEFAGAIERVISCPAVAESLAKAGKQFAAHCNRNTLRPLLAYVHAKSAAV